jgi:preprotein translocase subunit SecA
MLLEDYRRTDYKVPGQPLTGLDAVVNGAIGSWHRRTGVLEQLRKEAQAVDARAEAWKPLTDHQLQAKLLEFRECFRRGGQLAETTLLPALAAAREAADRILGLRAFPVQLMGALALHRGCLAEMATGEGKTLTAGLAAILFGWTKRPCHVVTVNDYLVQRDAEWLEPLFHFCGVRVGFVTGFLPEQERRKAYHCDVTYTTSKELLADFLRDRLHLGGMTHPTRRLIRRLLAPPGAVQDGLVMRGLHTAIIDEADSVLIDEAVTPLIIAASHKNEDLCQAAQVAQQMIATLKTGTDYRANPRYKEIELTPAGFAKLMGLATHLPGFWRGRDRRHELVVQALVAREFFHRDKQYIIEGDKVVIVDEFTGRPMPQRTWREGMHQAIEAKEGLPISDPSETIARLSFQRFFRCFHRVSGMTGTAREAAREFWQVYNLPVVTIPCNKPCIRQQWPDRVFAEESDKWNAVADEIAKIHRTGRPVLVGTRNVLASERLARMLESRSIPCQVLNAMRLKDEAAIVAMAGEPGRITIATNMAGRGTDIKLGHGVAQLGGLHVIATERHESSRVDRQLFGRSGRQGDPGSAQAFVSAQDELIQRYLPKPVRRAFEASLRRGLPSQARLADAAFRLAQRKAQSIAARQRQGILKSDLWMDEALSFTGGDTIG